MFVLYADKTQMSLRQREPVTSGSVNVYEVLFQFSEDWDGLVCTAVFRAGSENRSILLEDGEVCTIPWEVLRRPNVLLQAGVCGTRDGEVVLPTIWADLGVIQEGTVAGEEARPPTPDEYQQIMAELGETRAQTAQDAATAQDGASRAEIAAKESGYFFVEVQTDGCLHYIRSDKPETVGFELKNGELIASYA